MCIRDSGQTDRDAIANKACRIAACYKKAYHIISYSTDHCTQVPSNVLNSLSDLKTDALPWPLNKFRKAMTNNSLANARDCATAVCCAYIQKVHCAVSALHFRYDMCTIATKVVTACTVLACTLMQEWGRSV